MINNQQLEALFPETGHLGLGNTPFDNQVIPLAGWQHQNEQYFTLNLMKPGSTRADRNVLELSNFLLEFDDISLEEQEQLIDSLNIPFASVVFSGNKSLHVIISLKKPLAERAEYDELAKWLYAAVPNCDPSCKNPSRLTRLANGINDKTGKRQELKRLGQKVSKTKFMNWLRTLVKKPRKDVALKEGVFSEEERAMIAKTDFRLPLHDGTVSFIQSGGRKGIRHRGLFIAACNMRDCFYPIEEAKAMLLHRLSVIYKAEGREYDLEKKAEAIEYAYSLPVKADFKKPKKKAGR